MFYISDTIRKVMIDRRVSVTTLAAALGLLQPSLSRKLQNPEEDYKIAYLQNIAKALDCDIVIQIIDSKSGATLYTLRDE